MMIQKQRLIEAVQAIRDVYKITAEEWDEKHHEFSDAIFRSGLPDDVLPPKVDLLEAMRTELDLRMAEYLTRKDEDGEAWEEYQRQLGELKQQKEGAP